MSEDVKRILAEICFCNGQAAHRAEDYPSAEHWYANVLELQPDNIDVIYAASFPKALQRKWDEAASLLTVAMSSPKFAHDAEYCRGLVYNMKEDYVQGFKDIEARLHLSQLKHINDRFAGRKYWNGEACNTVYIFGEQGFGDILMFSRYLPLMKEKGVKKVVFEVPKFCLSLFKYNFRNNPEIEVISEYSDLASLGTNDAVLSSDYYIHMMSLVRVFGTTIDTIPPLKLEAEPEYIKKWEHVKGYVGTCYGGRPDNNDWQVLEWNSRRNVDKDRLDGILKEYKVVPIQKDFNDEIGSWSDTAGIIANTRFIVSVDSGPIHLAGAMQVPTILLNHYQTCWRWTLERKHTPWYTDKLLILRQPKEKDWDSVFKQLEDTLKLPEYSVQ